MTFAQAVTGSPLLYPLALDLRVDAVQFIRLTASEYAAASFLDDRLREPGVPTAAVPWADVRAAAEALTPRCHFIFHISHVGSTLLSRLVGEHPAVFSLREPAILRFLAETHRTLDQPDCPWSRAEFEDRLRAYLALWSRTFDHSQTAVIKATSFVGEMASHLLERVSSARAVLMTVRPEVFLRAMLGGAMTDIDSAIEKRLARLHRRLGETRWRAAGLSPGERVAMSWLSEMAALAEAADRFPSRTLWLDFDQFLEDPNGKLAAALNHFGVADAAAGIEAILAGPIMGRYAKAPEQQFDAAFRGRLLDQAGRAHATEIAKGLTWLGQATALFEHDGVRFGEAIPC
jgi:hypothetical protein